MRFNLAVPSWEQFYHIEGVDDQEGERDELRNKSRHFIHLVEERLKILCTGLIRNTSKRSRTDLIVQRNSHVSCFPGIGINVFQLYVATSLIDAVVIPIPEGLMISWPEYVPRVTTKTLLTVRIKSHLLWIH